MTIAVYGTAAICALFFPTAFPLVTTLLAGSPFSLISGGFLFWQYKKRQQEAFELLSRLAAWSAANRKLRRAA